MKQKLAYTIDNDNPAERKRFVRRTFDAISPTYDLLNRILSFGIDMRWRRFSVKLLGDLRGKRVLDTCAGTGDSSAVLAEKGADAVSLDFSLEMLRKGMATGRVQRPVAADASCLPFRDGSFTTVTV
ncbi:MAG TPA: class I SAM-dependent methyltransferase, partial [Spirochaetota bacterium]|nr:class I SAM-dependent methyltransferase [Spirochaetota bacterium]